MGEKLMGGTEGRAQLVAYACMHRLVEGTTAARKMDLEHLRRVVGLHRQAIAAQNKRDGIDDASTRPTVRKVVRGLEKP